MGKIGETSVTGEGPDLRERLGLAQPSPKKRFNGGEYVQGGKTFPVEENDGGTLSEGVAGDEIGRGVGRGGGEGSWGGKGNADGS